MKVRAPLPRPGLGNGVLKGLPPTPIGSPSVDSLVATVTPIKSNYLFFLADKSGVTHYCKDYACQLANKEKYF